MANERITLRVPAQPAYARSVRMMASNLAVVCGMNVDDVEEVRMAAEEGFVYSCATLEGDCDVIFELGEEGIAIDFSLGTLQVEAESDLQYANLLLSAVCDEFEVDVANSVLHLLKRACG